MSFPLLLTFLTRVMLSASPFASVQVKQWTHFNHIIPLINKNIIRKIPRRFLLYCFTTFNIQFLNSYTTTCKSRYDTYVDQFRNYVEVRTTGLKHAPRGVSVAASIVLGLRTYRFIFLHYSDATEMYQKPSNEQPPRVAYVLY